MREKRSSLRRMAAGICLSAAVAAGPLVLAAPASAAPSAAAAQVSAVHPKGPLPAAYYRGVALRVRTVVTPSTPAERARMHAAARNPCKTVTINAYYNNYLGMTLWNYYQHTSFCWDGVTVTNHVTWESVQIPGWAAVAGWSFKGVISSEFNCMYATSRWCSENHEYSQGEFDYCVLKIGCISSVYPWIDQYEYYDGYWWGDWGT